jgi:hypothetical protein
MTIVRLREMGTLTCVDIPAWVRVPIFSDQQNVERVSTNCKAR